MIPRRIWPLVVAFAALAAVSGCRDSRRRPSTAWKSEVGPITVAGVTLGPQASPRQVTEALLGVIRQSIDVRHQGLKDEKRAEEFDKLRDDLRHLAAPAAIRARASRDSYHLLPKDLTSEQAIDAVTPNWAAVVGHYIDGVDLAASNEQIGGEAEAVVLVPAVNPGEQAVIREIETSLANQRDERGEPLRPDSAVFHSRRREALVRRGIGPRPGAVIRVELARESGFWRVAAVEIHGRPSFAIVPTTQGSTPTMPAISAATTQP